MQEQKLSRWNAVARRTPPKDWLLRSELAAYFIRPTDVVCDLGAGAQMIREMLPPTVEYIPVDCVKQHDETVVIDLNGQFSLPDRPFNTILCLGLLRYLDDLPAFFERMVETQPGKFMIFTYGFTSNPSKKKMGSLDEGLEFFSQYIDGLRIISAIANDRYMFCGTLAARDQVSAPPAIPSLSELVSVNTKTSHFYASKLQFLAKGRASSVQSRAG